MRYRLFLTFLLILTALGTLSPVVAQSQLETYISQDGTTTLSYPHGWAVNEDKNEITLVTNENLFGNSGRALHSGEGRLILKIFDQDSESALNRVFRGTTSIEKLQNFVEAAQRSPEANATLNDAQPTEIGEHPAALSIGAFKATGNGLEIILVDFSNGSYGLILIESAPDELARLEPKMHSIVTTIEYSPPLPPPVNLSALILMTPANASGVTLLSTINAHLGLMHSIAISPDGQTIASGDFERGIQLWDTSTGKQKAMLKTQNGLSSQLLFTPDGQYLVTGEGDGTVRLWDLATGEQQSMTQYDGSVMNISVSPDGKEVAYISFIRRQQTEYTTVRLWNLNNYENYLVVNTSSIYSLAGGVAFSPDGQHLLYTTYSGDQLGVRLYDLGKREEISHWEREGYPIDLFFTSDSQPIVSINSDDWEETVLWNPQANTFQPIVVDDKESFSDFILNGDGSILATNTTRGKVSLWDIQTGDMLVVLPTDTAYEEMALSSDGRLCVTSDLQGRIYLWGISAST